MQGLVPIALGMVGLQFALFGNGLMLLGIDAKPMVLDTDGESANEEQPSPVKTVGAAATLIAAISLIFTAMWFVVGAPLGSDSETVPVQLTFSAIAGMHGFFFLGLAVAQLFDLDLRPLGNLALLCAIIQVLEMAIIASWGLTVNFLFIELALGSYVLVLLSFWAATHGRISTRPVGAFCLLAFVLTFYLLFWASGILPTP